MSAHVHERETWEGYGKPNCVEISEHVCMTRMGRHGKPDGYVSGFIIAHDVDGAEFRCEGAVNVDPELSKGDSRLWTMTGTLEGGDLSLSPSILCTTHPEFHAYVTNGRWTGG